MSELNRRETQNGIIKRMLASVQSEEFEDADSRMIKANLRILAQAFEKFQDEHMKIVAVVKKDDMDTQHNLYESVQQTYLSVLNILEKREEQLLAIKEQRDREQSEKEQRIRQGEIDSQRLNRGHGLNSASDGLANSTLNFGTESTNQPSEGLGHVENGNLSDRTNRFARIETDEFLLDRFKPQKFYGVYAKWSEWKSSFDSMVHNTALNDTKKIYMLKQCLAGQAERILSGWQVIGENYADAYKTVCEIYENRYRIVMAHLDELHSIPKTETESYESIRAMIDTTNSVMRQLRVCGSPVEHWDQFLAHHLITRMSPRALATWETSQDLKQMPTVQEVLQFLEKRARGQLNFTQASTSNQNGQNKNKQQNATGYQNSSTGQKFQQGKQSISAK